MQVHYTGVKATPEELVELQALAKTASQTPVMTMNSDQPSFAERAWERCLKRTHVLALAHGLPEITGYYGITQDGEFVRT
jgi:hypothetical protein